MGARTSERALQRQVLTYDKLKLKALWLPVHQRNNTGEKENGIIGDL